MVPAKLHLRLLCRGQSLVFFSHCRTNTSAEAKDNALRMEVVCGNERNLSKQPNPDTPRTLNKMAGPRGARKLPYIGTLLMFKPFSPFTVENFDRMVSLQHDKYGGIFKMRMGKEYTVFTENVSDVETIFRTEGPYPRRRLMNLNKVYRERNNLPLALGGLTGPEWYELRRPLNPLLVKPQVCLHYLPAQNSVADDFVKRLAELQLSAEQQCEEFFKYAAESIGVVCFNHRLGFINPATGSDAEKKYLLDAFKTVMHCNYVAMVGLERKYQYSEKDEFYQLYSRAMKLIAHESMNYVTAVTDEMKKKKIASTENTQQASELEVYNETNLLASLIATSGLEMDKIIAIIESLLVVGTDSSAKNLAVLLYNLAMNPAKQQKAATEITEILGPNAPVTPKALSEMHYLKACVKESMRLNFPTANGTMRILTQDTVLSGYLVPKDTNVILGMRRIAQNSRYFPDPHIFRPERWVRYKAGSSAPSDEMRPAFSFLPFGHGVRGCIGRRFAEMEIHVAAAKVLQRLKVKVASGYGELDPVYTPFITPKSHIPFIFERRKI